MAKRILKEAFNLKNANYKSKDGNEHKIAYIDPTTSENTFAFKDAIKKFGAKFFSSIKAWGGSLEIIQNMFIETASNLVWNT